MMILHVLVFDVGTLVRIENSVELKFSETCEEN